MMWAMWWLCIAVGEIVVFAFTSVKGNSHNDVVVVQNITDDFGVLSNGNQTNDERKLELENLQQQNIQQQNETETVWRNPVGNFNISRVDQHNDSNYTVIEKIYNVTNQTVQMDWKNNDTQILELYNGTTNGSNDENFGILFTKNRTVLPLVLQNVSGTDIVGNDARANNVSHVVSTTTTFSIVTTIATTITTTNTTTTTTKSANKTATTRTITTRTTTGNDNQTTTTTTTTNSPCTAVASVDNDDDDVKKPSLLPSKVTYNKRAVIINVDEEDRMVRCKYFKTNGKKVYFNCSGGDDDNNDHDWNLKEKVTFEFCFRNYGDNNRFTCNLFEAPQTLVVNSYCTRLSPSSTPVPSSTKTVPELPKLPPWQQLSTPVKLEKPIAMAWGEQRQEDVDDDGDVFDYVKKNGFKNGLDYKKMAIIVVLMIGVSGWIMSVISLMVLCRLFKKLKPLFRDGKKPQKGKGAYVFNENYEPYDTPLL